ncbi:unnamed protein product [Rhizoctonia solani]|uniref:F-box domain-containing protein n=1 Tax=Rhizoctonia solani TaxID=456999 RepID=A0A8H3GIY4_9AGAM|nr:unnamed protein product [Rhizoctonia solani]
MNLAETTEGVAMIMDGAETEPKNLQFTNLPHELFSEIAKRLYPLDLIYLARVNKFFRRVLMDPSSAEIWRATLANADLPPCPDDDMSEPEYAALMFDKQCTECGDPASCHMDPIFMIRLCSGCRKDLALKAEKVDPILQPMILRSQFLVPPKGIKRPYWCMRDEYEEVDQVYNLLRAEGDHHAMRAYTDTRNKMVRDWSQATKPLVDWVQKREKQRKLELNKLQVDRQAEIEARLLQLGWAQVDVRDCFYFSPDAKPMVSKAKVLDDEDWNAMLPHLLKGLETARGHRLEREANGRRLEHEDIFNKWLNTLPEHSGRGKKKDITIQIPSLPANRYVLKWPLIEELLNQDKPTGEFNSEFESKKEHIKEQFSGWRFDLEAALVKALPEAFKPVELQSSQFNLEAHAPTEHPLQYEDRLSADLRTLLRADVIFEYDYKPTYYPSSFTSWTIDARTPTYDTASSTVAKTILNALQHPDASYLEMQALGRSFLCARCTSNPHYLNWGGIVSHFAYENERWESASRWNKLYREEGEGITLVFTHDINNSNEPLVRLVAEADQIKSPKAPQSECKVCLSIGQHYRTELAYIAKHMQVTHLIENAVQGEHYT